MFYNIKKYRLQKVLAKNKLFRFTISHYQKVYEFMFRFNYPNVKEEYGKDFCQELLNMISIDCKDSFPLEYLSKCLEKAQNSNELIFLKGNEDSVIIDNYYLFYLRPVNLFRNSFHTFDIECKIKEEIEKYDFYIGTRRTDNYIFVNSKEDPLVQVSDCIVGFLGKYFIFINELELSDISNICEKMSDVQKDTLSLFARLIIKSEKLCPMLFHSCESLYEYTKNANVIKWALNYERNKRVMKFLRNSKLDRLNNNDI